MNQHTRTIIHINIDCFYAQVEMIKNPDLRYQALGIQQKGIVVTSNYIARQQGIKKLMPITEAQKLCPNLVLVKGEDLYDYRHVSQQVSDLLSEYSQFVERLGLDENFVDVTELVTKRINEDISGPVGVLYGDKNNWKCDCGCKKRLIVASVVAKEMRDAIFEKLQLTTCAGIAHNKLLAKIVGSCNKPNQQTLLLPNSAPELMVSLENVEKIPWVGQVTKEFLSAVNINTVIDLQNADKGKLEKACGPEKAQHLLNLSFGIDDTPVKLKTRPQSYGIEDAGKDLKYEKDVEDTFTELYRRLMKLITEDGRLPKVIKISICRHNAQMQAGSTRVSRQGPFNVELNNEAGAVKVAMSLFWKAVDKEKPFHINLLGLAFLKLVDKPSEKNTLLGFFKRSADFAESSTKKPKIEIPVQTPMITCECPPNIDREIFKELPFEIQQELWVDFNQNKDRSNKPCKSRKSGTLLDFVVRQTKK